VTEKKYNVLQSRGKKERIQCRLTDKLYISPNTSLWNTARMKYFVSILGQMRNNFAGYIRRST